jgi:putative transcriptional regulator
MVLVASPHLKDPHFTQAVVYLVDHGPDGSLGFIVNRPLDVPLSTLWDEVPTRFRDLRIAALGGPVDPDKGLLLHGHPDLPESQPMAKGIAVGGSISALLTRYADGPDQTGPRLLLGHSGWVPGQLDHELSAGAWLLRPGQPSWLLDAIPPVHLWQHLLDGRPGLPDPSLN